MALADVDSEIRIILKVGAVLATIAVLIFVLIKGYTIAQSLFFPPPPQPPDEKFGKLPDLPGGQTKPGLEFRINTVDGTLPSFSDRITVYKIKREEPSLVALGNARSRVAEAGYTQNETKISALIYQWTAPAGEVLQYNLLTNNFKIYSNLLTDPAPTKLSGTAATPKGAYNTATGFLENIGVDISDIDPENFKGSYLKIVDGQLTRADGQGDAQFLRVDLYQKNINEKYKVFYPNQRSSNIFFIFRNEDDLPRIVQANFDHFVIDPGEEGVYPIKSSDAAFKDLQDGNAIILNQNENPVIDITDVTIGYYLSEQTQEYAIPIIVFIGANFTSYVQAVP